MAKTDATISVGADGSAFTAAVQGMAKGVETMANGITARLARMGQAFEGLSRLGSMVSGALRYVTGPASEVEDKAAALGVVLRTDAEAARELATDLQLMAANGVVSFDDLFGAARALGNVYQDSGNLKHWTGVFADIAAGSKISATRLGELVARLHDMGKAEFTELANAGIPIFEALGQVTGKDAAELQKLAAAGKIAMGDVLQAFKLMTSEGGKFHKMNETLSATTSGSFNTLSASISTCAGILGAPINDAIRPFLQELATMVQELRPQIEEVAGTLGGVFAGAAQAVRPVFELLASVAGYFNDMGRVIGYAAAALLVYAANANRAAASTFSFSTSIGSLWGKLKGLKLGSIFTSFSGMMGAAKRGFAGFCGFLSTSWKSVCISMGIAMRTAATVIKSALISTGIGALIVLIGEGISAIYNWFAGVDEGAQNAARSARQFERALKDIKKSAEGVQNEADMAAVEEQVESKLDDLKEEIAEAHAEGEKEKVKQLQAQYQELSKWMDAERGLMKVRVERAKAAERERQNMEEQKRLAEETARAEAERWKTIQQMRGQRSQTMFERDMEETRAAYSDSVEGSKRVIFLRLDKVGMRSVEQLEEEVRKLENVGNPTQWQLDRYQALADTLAKVDDELRRIDQAERASTAENEKRKKNYYDRRATFNESQDEDVYDAMDVAGQARYIENLAKGAGNYYGGINVRELRKELDELARVGAKENEARIAVLEKVLQLHVELVKRKKEYERVKADNKTALRIQALELSGQKAAADKLRAAQEYERRVAELQGQGYSKGAAEKLAAREGKMKEAAALQEKLQGAQVKFVQSSLASVGGGVSRRLGTGQLAEAKRHSKLLKEIRDEVKRGGKQAAVLA